MAPAGFCLPLAAGSGSLHQARAAARTGAWQRREKRCRTKVKRGLPNRTVPHPASVTAPNLPSGALTTEPRQRCVTCVASPSLPRLDGPGVPCLPCRVVPRSTYVAQRRLPCRASKCLGQPRNGQPCLPSRGVRKRTVPLGPSLPNGPRSTLLAQRRLPCPIQPESRGPTSPYLPCHSWRYLPRLACQTRAASPLVAEGCRTRHAKIRQCRLALPPWP